MRKIASRLVLFIVLILLVFPKQASFAEIIDKYVWGDFVYTEGNYYQIEGDKYPTVSILRYKGDETSLEIPEEINGYIVSWIGEKTFRKCKSLESVFIPKDVSLGTALSNAPSLVKVRVSKEHRRYRVQNNLLLNKKKNTLINIPGGRTSIKIPKSVNRIVPYAFNKARKIKKITLGGNINNIGHTAFKSCVNLQTFRMGNKVKKLRSGTFFECSKLENIKLSKSLKSIGENAFFGCKQLKRISIPKKVKKIEESSFYGCKSLKDIKIPKNVREIGGTSFKGCSRLRKIYIYNRNCKINYEGEGFETFPKKAVIYGYKGSTAEKFAKNKGYKFKEI